jgi:hypothetical protein
MTTNNEEQDALAQIRALRADLENLKRQRVTALNKRDLTDCRHLRQIQDGQTDVYDSSVGGWVPAALPSGGGGGARWATVVVAPAGATAESLAAADVVLTGTADQTLINAALTTMGTIVGERYGGQMVVLEGTIHLTGPINLPGQCTLRGMNRGSTRIDCYSGFTAGDGAIVLAEGSSEVHDFEIESADSMAGVYGISITGHSATISGVRVSGSFSRAISITGATPGSTIRDCILIASSHTAYCIYEVGTLEAHIVNNRLTGGTGMRLTGAHAVVTGNALTSMGRQGIVLDGATRCLIQGNVISVVSTQTTNTYDGIQVVTGLENNIQGNTIRKASAGVQNRYGIRIEAGATSTFVTNNDLLTSGFTGSFSNAGVGTVTVAGNRL